MSTLALTQCWYTRQHRPVATPRERVEGAFYAYCRHCRRPIFSCDGQYWHLDGGFNMETLGEKANSFLSVVDVADGMIVARVAVPPEADESFVEALKAEIAERYGIGQHNTNLAIRDNRPGKHPAPRSNPARARKPRPAA